MKQIKIVYKVLLSRENESTVTVYAGSSKNIAERIFHSFGRVFDCSEVSAGTAGYSSHNLKNTLWVEVEPFVV